MPRASKRQNPLQLCKPNLCNIPAVSVIALRWHISFMWRCFKLFRRLMQLDMHTQTVSDKRALCCPLYKPYKFGYNRRHTGEHTPLGPELRAISLTLHKSQCCSSVSQSFTQRGCSNNQPPCPNMLIHLLHPYSHGHRLPRVHTHTHTHTHTHRVSVRSIS